MNTSGGGSNRLLPCLSTPIIKQDRKETEKAEANWVTTGRSGGKQVDGRAGENLWSFFPWSRYR